MMFPNAKTTVIYAPAGSGKFLKNSARVYTPTGYSLMGELEVGDTVLDGWGNPCKVIGVYPQGKRAMYRINFSDRTHLDVGDEHLNVVHRYNQDKKCKETYVMKAEELIELLKTSRFSIRVEIPVVKGFEHREVPIEPYLLGALIGDGTLGGSNLGFSNAEYDLIAKVDNALQKHGLTLKRRVEDKYDYNIITVEKGRHRANEFKKLLSQMSLDCSSLHKHIPQMYLYNSFETRLGLLRGLIDTDGFIGTDGYTEFSTSSKLLAKDVAELCRSLGIRVTTAVKEAFYTKNGERIYCNDSYRLHLKVPNDIVIGSSKKFLARHKKRQTEPIRKILSIRPIEWEEATCISVDSPYKTYLTDNFTPTHNTTGLISRASELLKEYRSSDMAFVSFTRKGAIEGINRMKSECGLKDSDLPYFGTLHSICSRAQNLDFKKKFGFGHIKKFYELTGFRVGNTGREIDYVAYYDRQRHGLPQSKLIEDIENLFEFERFQSVYEEYKRVQGLYDYTDCLLSFVEKGEALPISVAFIDEAQDLTPLQWKVVKVMFQNAKVVVIAGDDYQSIYTYGAAIPQAMFNLAKTSEVIRLEKSYRLPRSVYRLAKKVTDSMGWKVDKKYEPFRHTEGSVQRIDRTEAMRILVEDCAEGEDSWYLLFRYNYLLEQIREELDARLIPYTYNNQFCLDKKYLTKIQTYNLFREQEVVRGIDRATFAEQNGVLDFNEDFYHWALFPSQKEALKYQAYVDLYGLKHLTRMCGEDQRIHLSTIHKIKGGEAENVMLFCDMTEKLAEGFHKDPDSEMRVLYVALTRARQNLFIVQKESQFGLDDILDIAEQYG